jgi:hypothetical protein
MERRTQKPTTEAVALEKELIDGVGLTQFARKSKSERVLWGLCGTPAQTSAHAESVDEASQSCMPLLVSFRDHSMNRLFRHAEVCMNGPGTCDGRGKETSQRARSWLDASLEDCDFALRISTRRVFLMHTQNTTSKPHRLLQTRGEARTTYNVMF